MCARCWSKCKLRNFIRLEKAAQALDGGWRPEMQVDKRGKGYLCSIGFHLACMLGWQEKGPSPAAVSREGRETGEGGQSPATLQGNLLCYSV